MERDTDFFFDFSGLMERDTDKAAWMLKLICIFNPIALKTAKTRWSFGHFECNRVQDYTWVIEWVNSGSAFPPI